MRILWLKSDLLLPLDKGGKLRTWHVMRHLAKRHQITYLGFARPGEAYPDVLDGMRAVATRVDTIPRTEPPKGSFRFYADVGRHLCSALPYAVGKYRSRAFARRLNDLLSETAFDLVVCDFLFPAVNLPARLPCPAVIFTHNVEAEIWRRHAGTRSGIDRMLYGIQHRRMLRYEARALRRFDGVLAVSEADRRTFARVYGISPASIHVIPTGVDTEFFTPRPSPSASRTLVFTGSMDWLPNEDAMVFFCREILARIRAEEPDTSVAIVGREPTAAVRKLANDSGVTVTGSVEDVRPFMREAAVYVVPLRIAGGTRLKIFEALAMGKAVVSTTIGAEGLPVTNGEHLLLADEPQAFARAVVRLLRDVERRRRLEDAARALVVGRYDWAAVAAQMEETLTQCARVRSRTVVLGESAPQPTDGIGPATQIAS